MLTLWYQLGSPKGICWPNGSRASDCSAGAATADDAALGLGVSFLGTATGMGSAAGLGLVSSDPTWSCFWYFLRMPSLWYFQNCLDASLPATRWRIFLPPGEMCQ